MRSFATPFLALSMVLMLLAGCGAAEPEGYEAGDAPEAVKESQEADAAAEKADEGSADDEAGSDSGGEESGDEASGDADSGDSSTDELGAEGEPADGDSSEGSTE